MLNFELHFWFLLLHIKQLCSEMVAYFFHPHSLSALIQVKSLTKTVTWPGWGADSRKVKVLCKLWLLLSGDWEDVLLTDTNACDFCVCQTNWGSQCLFNTPLMRSWSWTSMLCCKCHFIVFGSRPPHSGILMLSLQQWNAKRMMMSWVSPKTFLP